MTRTSHSRHPMTATAPLSRQPPSQSELPQEPPLYESAPQWGQQPLPRYRQPPDGQPQYGGSPIPPNWSPQPPRKRSLLWLWITQANLGGLIALCCIGVIFVTLSIGSVVRQAGLLTCLSSDVPTTGSSIGFPAQQAGPVTLHTWTHALLPGSPAIDLSRLMYV